MPGPSKHRRKKTEPERINLEDWSNAGALDGLLSFLNIAPEQAPINRGQDKVLDLLDNRKHPEQALSITDTVSVSGPQSITGTPADKASSLTLAQANPDQTSHIPATLSDIDRAYKGPPSETDTAPVIDRAAWLHPKQASGFGNKKLYRCVLAQDGHSHTEEALYQILWRSGKPEAEDSRITVMGYGEMSKRVRLSFNNTKYACQRLIAKLAIEEIAREISDKRQGKTYRVYSYRTILERRRARGMEWVIRNKGVEFVTPVIPSGMSISGALSVIDMVPITAAATPSKTGAGTGSITDSLLEHSFRNRQSKPSSSSPEAAAILQALSDYGQPDDDIVQTLLLRCRQSAADCKPQEIIHYIHQKGALLKQDHSSRIANPLGFLLTAVPKCLVGETFAQYRQQEQKRIQEQLAIEKRQTAEIEQWRREQEAVLADPQAPEDEKQFARQILGIG